MRKEPVAEKTLCMVAREFLAALDLANGAWMLARPSLLYTDLSAQVPDFGPYNEHGFAG